MSTEQLRTWPDPKWLRDLPESEQSKSRVRVCLTIACIYHSDKGRAGSLAESIGMTANAFALMKLRGEVPPKTAVELEKELGRDLFPRECFCPEIFEVGS